MSNYLPKITIVTPVYNSVDFIESAITSVLNQNYENIEYIIVDGGSTDGTVQIIEKYASKLAYCVSEKDDGQSQALNKGFAKATGDIYGWLNADEEYLPGTLEKVANCFKQDKDLDLVFGYRIHCDKNGIQQYVRRYPSIHPLNYMLYAARVLPSDATFWTSRIHTITGTLDENNYAQLAMDTDWFLRMSKNVTKWKKLPFALSKFKEHLYRKTTQNIHTAKKLGVDLSREFLRKHKMSLLRLFVGWLVWGAISRLYEPQWYKFPRPDVVIRRMLNITKP